MKWYAASAAMLGLCLCSAGPACAEVAEAGVRYPGGSRIEVQQLGFSLQVPANWVGVLSKSAKNFVLGSRQEAGMVIIGLKRRTTVDSLQEYFELPIRLDAKTTLRPRGKPSVEDERVQGDFTARVSGATLTGHGQAYLLRGTDAITFFGIGPPEQAQRMKDLITSVRRSVRVLEADAPSPTSGD